MRIIRSFALALALVGFSSAQASATWWHHDPTCDPDSVGSGTVEIADSVTGAFWTFSVDYEVFSDNNCANPVKVEGSFTYIYTVTLTDEGPVPINLDEFKVVLDGANFVLDTGYISGGPGVAPTSVVVEPDPFNTVAASFDTFALGDTSLPIYLVSPFRPGDGSLNINANLFSGTSPAVVPSELPEPTPCSAFFWKLRSLNWWWVVKYFPGEQFDIVKTRAVELSGGFFADEGELVSALYYWGFLDAEKRARRQLAAVLLNVAAGEKYPANTKCRLFLGTPLDLDGDDVPDSTVDEAIGSIITGIESGDWNQQNDAFQLGLDINLGRNVVGAVCFH